MQTLPVRITSLVALLGCGLVAGCTAISDLNPLNRGSNQPLPPVTGNVIATSSSSNLEDRLGTTTAPGLADPTASGDFGTTGEACPDGVSDPDNCPPVTVSTD